MAHIKEKDIEEAIQNATFKSGFAQSVSSDFDRVSCINKKELFKFLESTQNELLEEFKKLNKEYLKYSIYKVFGSCNKLNIIKVSFEKLQLFVDTTSRLPSILI